MSKRILYVLAPLIVLSCNFLFRPGDAPLQTPPEADSAESASSAPQVYPAANLTIVRVHTQNGDLPTQLAAEVQKAESLGQQPFIEFDATWCPPCQAIDASIEAQDSLTMNAFKDVYLIRADVDEWGWRIDSAFNFEAIPVYYKLDENGQPTGDVVDGGAWNEDIPENFAPVLDEFFH